MNTPTLRHRPLATALALAFLPAATALAQQAAPAPDPSAADGTAETAPAAAAGAEGGLNLDRIVVTGSTTARSKMKQSVSVSTVGSEQVQNSTAASAVEVLRAVPGLRAESSGGEGNANLGVRGLPMSDGGGRYVQLQEDGLPVMLVGDVSFATADQFVRADYMLDSIDVVRGGSASTLSTNSPGAIVNFIGTTGKTPGTMLGMSLGLDHRQQRLDFQHGGKLGERLYYSVGGFYRLGEGTRHTDITAEQGGQLRASVTKELDNEGSYLRLNLKHLKDNTPTYLPVPVQLDGNRIEQIPGVDPRTAFFINSNFPTDVVVGSDGQTITTNPGDGLGVEVTSLGLEAHLKLGDGWSVTERLRKSDISGRFIGVFPAGSQPSDYTGDTPVFSAHIFNSSLDDMGNVFNDLRVQKELPLGQASKLTVTGGLFSGVQHIAQTWYWNRYNIGLTGEGAALYDNAGNVTTQPVGDATTTWGGCCFRALDVELTAVAPYAAVAWDAGPLNLDASLRHDRQRGTGSQRFGDAASGGTWNPERTTAVHYSTDATSYSLGGNYELGRDLALFSRFSHGVSWKSPDRVLWDTRVATGLDPYPVNEVDQFEAGVKFRRDGLNAFVTFFDARTKEGAGYEVTTRTVKKDSYTSRGIEAELSWRWGDLRLTGGATWTQAEIDSGDFKGNTPRRQADWVYQVSPAYRFGTLEVGGAIIGTTRSYAQNDNQVVLPGFAVVNLFANYEVNERTTVSLGINNAFDQLGYTEAEAQNNLGDNPLYIARAVNGRSAKVSLKYAF
jgi:outer membrane receptor protein involved in Fe transport